jgi:hypothetical protein
MAIVLTDTGKQKALEYLVGKNPTTESLILRLFSNDVDPEEEDIYDNYTEVTVANGYAAKGLSLAEWSVAAGSAVYPQQTWTFTGAAGAIYGYYVATATTNDLIFAERFSGAPYTVSTDGDIINVTLNITLI